MRNLSLVLLMSAVACSDKEESSGGDTGTTGGGGGGGGGDIADYINVTDAPVGNLSCFSAADGLGTESAAPGCVGERQMSGSVVDFQEGDPVDEATVELFFGDSITDSSPPDVVYESDPNGLFTGSVMACSPFTYRVSTDPALELTKVTIESHDVMPNEGPTIAASHELNSVSSVTYALIPNLLGLSPDVTKGIVAGRAYDCDGQNLEGAQVVVHDGAGNIPEGVVVKYFVDEFPSRSQFSTSADGLWIIMDVPEGNWTVDGYVADGMGGHSLVASTQLRVLPDSINISSIYTGISDGIKMPEQCLTSCN